MKIIFFGTPEYVLVILETLHKTFKKRGGESPIAAVVTQPPKPTGRKKLLEYSPVDSWAHKKGVPIFFEPRKIVENNLQAEVGILASYGAIIPKEVIDFFPKGILNIHPSLLPAWRGSSPVQATIISGGKAGVTIIKIDEKLDHGPIVAQFKEDVLSEDTSETLRRRLFERSAKVLETLIPAYVQGKITPREQDHSKATFTFEIRKEDAFIPPEFLDAALHGKTLKANWQIPFMKIDGNPYNLQPTTHNLNNFIRAMHPWPGAWSKIRIRNQELRIKIIKSKLSTPANQNPQLILEEVQLEGKNKVSWTQFKQGYPQARFV